MYKIYKDNVELATSEKLCGALSLYDILILPGDETDQSLYSIFNKEGTVVLLGTRQPIGDWRAANPDMLALDNAVSSMIALKAAV